MSPHTRPLALLLDFGGVIVHSAKPSGWKEIVTDALIDLVGADRLPERERLLADIGAGSTAAGLWRNAMSRPRHPVELDQRTFVMDFVAADWTPEQRAAIEPHIATLCYSISSTKEERTLLDGIEDLLVWCRSVQMPVAIVSNASSGAVHRDYLVAAGLSDYFVAEIYSDEVGLRKPNPDIMMLGSAAVGVAPEDCWYVGDHLDRDVLCGVRAGIGANVLIPSPTAVTRPFVVPVSADHIVSSPRELLHLLENTHD
jgi:HAD superfamily hydrolase (TIGR01549 family)